MNLVSERALSKFEIFLLIFITLQPVIDILTTLSIKSLSESATIGIFIRLLVMLACMVYIFTNEINNKSRKVLIYLLCLFITLTANLVINFFVKENFFIVAEIKFLAKVVYVQIMLFSYIILFKAYRKSILNHIKKYILNAILIINSVMIISILTSTSLQSYDYTKIGYTGWFFAGNEIGAILAILFPISLMIAVHKTKTILSFYHWIPVVLTGFSLLMLGTKVGYGALIVGLLASVFICFINWITKKNKMFLVNGLISIFMFIALIVITPFTPIFSNTFAHLELLGISLDGNNEENEPTGTPGHKETKIEKSLPNVEKKQVENLILSSREDFLRTHQDQFSQAPLNQKLFGMGYAGNYSDQPKMIEMDFYDLFYSLGIIGFIIYIFPFLFIFVIVGVFSLKNIKQLFEPVYLFLLLSLTLGLGISYTAGHVLTAPAVSIYLSVIMALIYEKINFHQKSISKIK